MDLQESSGSKYYSSPEPEDMVRKLKPTWNLTLKYKKLGIRAYNPSLEEIS